MLFTLSEALMERGEGVKRYVTDRGYQCGSCFSLQFKCRSHTEISRTLNPFFLFCFVLFSIHKSDLKFLKGQYNVSKADFLQNVIYRSQQGFQFSMISVIYAICFQLWPEQISSWMLFQGCISQILQGQNSRQVTITLPKDKHLLNFYLVCIQTNLLLTSSQDPGIWPKIIILIKGMKIKYENALTNITMNAHTVLNH